MSPLETALLIAAADLPVFPCGRNKRPCIPKSQDGGRGFLDASTDPERVRFLFAHSGAALVGVPTGERSGFDVLDIDPRHGGDEWETENSWRLPDTRIHQTKSGGRHWLFLHATGVRNSASKKGFSPGVDTRGEGGYIVAPPSPGYRVINESPIAHWPDWLLQPGLALSEPPPARPVSSSPMVPISETRIQRLIDMALAKVSGAPKGGKHFTLRNMALLLGGIATRAGLNDADLIERLIRALPAGVEDWETARETAAWGLTNGRNNPIELPLDDDILADDPRRKETARAAFRLLRMGVETNELLQSLHNMNGRRSDPLPARMVNATAVWAARRHAG